MSKQTNKIYQGVAAVGRKLKIGYLLPVVFALSCSCFSFAQQVSPAYPVLRKYDQQHIGRIALPIGGIGTGNISLGGSGDIRQVEIMNIPGKQYTGSAGKNDLEAISPFFCLYAKAEGEPAVTRALAGPVAFYDYEAMMGQPVANHGLPRFRQVSFDAAYPFGQVHLDDDQMPLQVTIKAFNPLIPGDADASGIPIAVFRFVLKNKTSKNIVASVCSVMDNFIGIDGSKTRKDFKGEPVYTGAVSNKNEFRRDSVLAGIYMHTENADTLDAAWGTMAITTEDRGLVTYKLSTDPLGSGSTILSFWDDFSADGRLRDTAYHQPDRPTAALASEVEIPAGAEKEISFYLTWRFPNRYGWSKSVVGNYYATKYTDAWHVIQQTYPSLAKLEAETISFVNTFLQSDLPVYAKEAALFNVSTLRSQTVFRTADGNLFGWEGVFDQQGSCFGSCTHVWNYEQVTPFLFGDLARAMRHVEFGYSTDDSGKMAFRTPLPLEKMKPGNDRNAAADGQMGTIMRFYREWQFSGDDRFLRTHWERIKKSLAFAWIPKGWDSDRDGVMEGCQHNTMDVEYYGPNPQMQLWYLGALKATAAMATHLRDNDFAKECNRLYQYGSAWMDANLFNGEYYIQQVKPPGSRDNIHPSLIVGMGTNNFVNPEYQLAEGCLVDQLVGQYMAHICGLGYLADSAKIRATLRSIMKYNYRDSLYDHFNNMRSYVFNDEAALLMACYPGKRPAFPFPYFNEVMTGFEYVAAIGMLYENQTANGLKCINSIRDRYDGRKRNPFDEAECGHHYARAMASWGIIPAICDFNFSAVRQSMSFAAKPGTWFWSNGYAWGSARISGAESNYATELTVVKGKLVLHEFKTGDRSIRFKKAIQVEEGKPYTFRFF